MTSDSTTEGLAAWPSVELRRVCTDLDDPDKFGTPGAFEHIAIHLLRDLLEHYEGKDNGSSNG